MRTLFRTNAALAHGLAIVAALLIAAMILAITAEVLLRALRLGAIPGILEGTEYALYFSTFLAAPWLYARSEHIRVDIVVGRLGAETGRWADFAVAALVFVVSCVFCVYGARVFWQSLTQGTRIFKDVVLMQWWIDWALPVAFLSIALMAAERLVAAGARERDPAAFDR